MLTASVTSASGNKIDGLKNGRFTRAIDPGDPIDGGVGADLQVIDIPKTRDSNSFKNHGFKMKSEKHGHHDIGLIFTPGTTH